ncbi:MULTISPECIES: hypothetical protein [Flavobacterium]|jgi:hypothetical protein|nr:hypothetical protein [Flavobacterium anhuiense]
MQPIMMTVQKTAVIQKREIMKAVAENAGIALAAAFQFAAGELFF